MKKPLHRTIALFLSVLFLMPLTIIPVFAVSASSGFYNFSKINSYIEGQFSDVPSSAWFSEYVKNAYELGLFNGTGNNTFSPNNNITIAETITLASRIHNIYSGNSHTFEATTPWYQTYFDYAVSNDIVTGNRSWNFSRNANRAEFANILVKSLPENALFPINSISSIPDVTENTMYYDSIYMLYNAGILKGTDKYGTFNPYSEITRSEAATIVSAIADPTLRRTFTLISEADERQSQVYDTLYREIFVNHNVTVEGLPAFRVISPQNAGNDMYWLAITPNFNEIEVYQEFVSGKYTYFSQLYLTRTGQNYLFRCGVLHRGGNANIVGTVHVDPHGLRPSTNLFFETFTGTSGSVTPGNQAFAQQMAITMLCGSLCRINNVDTEYFSEDFFSVADFGFDEAYFQSKNVTYWVSQN